MLGDTYANAIDGGTERSMPAVWPLVMMLPRSLRAV